MDNRSGRTNGTHGSRDIYKQLIDNDMVKELDDIEAISQQISQHAEVLYNSWKNNGISQNSSSPHYQRLNSSQSISPSLEETSNPLSRDLRERGGGASSPRQENGQVLNRNQAQFNGSSGRPVVKIKFPTSNSSNSDGGYGSLDRQNSAGGGRNTSNFSTHSLDRHGTYPVFDRQNSLPDRGTVTLDRQYLARNSSSPRNSASFSSPPSSTRESPSKGSSITHITSPPSQSNLNTDVGPLELLASPNLNGNLEELVTSFVSTDRAKQAARNTISSTIMRRLGSPNGSASPVRSPSPTPSQSYLGASPLRSPMLTNSIRSVGSPDPNSPKTSLNSMFPNSDTVSPMGHSMSPFQIDNSFVHAPMESIFAKKEEMTVKSPPVVLHSPVHVKSPEVSRSQDQPDSIAIPVKVVSTPSSSQGLKSPSVLQNVNKNPFQFPITKPANSEQHGPMPNLFDQFGSVKDPDESLMAMRRRFEEAKQRMALSLPAREGGLRPNSLIARSLFDGEKFQSPWGDDASSFLLEQLRRKNKRRMETPAAPHPELTPQQRQHIFERSSIPSTLQAGAPMRRMLPGGSVAERVLMFEKSPSIFGLDPGQTRLMPQRREPMVTGTALTPWRSQAHEQQGKQVAKKERIVPISRLEAAPLVQPVVHIPKPSLPPPQSFSRQQPSTTFRPPSLHLPGKEEIPKFYFPSGKPAATGKAGIDTLVKKFTEEFSKHKNNSVNLPQLGEVLKACGLPLFLKSCVWSSCGAEGDSLTLSALNKTWRKLMQSCHDEASQFLALITGGTRSHLVPEDLVPLIQDIVDTHPGLLFLKEATEFHSRYVHTVIARIFYVVNRSWSGKISLSELRRSNLLSTIRTLQEEDDINQVTHFFSYEHFYVIYCKFWELDKDHDLFIDREDLARHNDHALSTRMIDRIFCGAVTRGTAQREGRMCYTEFVWFLLSEEDKRHPTAIEYWFRCMDLDGDGVLSMYELEYYYEEQLQRMEQLGIETLPFDDCLCQMLDMIRPQKSNNITLRDLKRCKMTPIFFDTFFNLEKYLDHEQRDPFATQRETDEDGNEMSDWDRFAAEEYELLVAEEGTGENMEDMAYEEGQLLEGPPEDSMEREMLKNS